MLGIIIIIKIITATFEEIGYIGHSVFHESIDKYRDDLAGRRLAPRTVCYNTSLIKTLPERLVVILLNLVPVL